MIFWILTGNVQLANQRVIHELWQAALVRDGFRLKNVNAAKFLVKAKPSVKMAIRRGWILKLSSGSGS